MEVTEIFWNVTFPLLVTLLVTLITLIITFLLEKGNLRKLDKLDSIESNLRELRRDVGDTLKNTINQLIEIIKHPPSAKSDPLPPDKVKRRDFLLDKGRTKGLDEKEAAELRELLQEQAIEAGLTGLALLAFLGMVALVLGYFLSRRESNK
jgi:hypothetical protein